MTQPPTAAAPPAGPSAARHPVPAAADKAHDDLHLASEDYCRVITPENDLNEETEEVRASGGDALTLLPIPHLLDPSCVTSIHVLNGS